MQRIYDIFVIDEDAKYYYDTEIDQTLLTGVPKHSVLSFKEEEHK